MEREPVSSAQQPNVTQGQSGRAADASEDGPRVWWSVPLVTIAGIRVRVHVTFFFLVALVAWASSLPDGPGAFAGIGWLVLLFACVVVHEFAHALVARRRGIVVREVLLLPIGGVSKMESLPERWNDELAIAIAGPLASIGLALGTGVAAVALGVPLVPVSLIDGAILARLAWVNLLLAGFNLLPAFPLDGGRVLRALLERRHDLDTATRIAARIGRIAAIVMMVVGVFFDFWLVLIGAFIYFGASAEERMTRMHIRLAPLHVRDLLVGAPLAFDPHDRVGDVEFEARHALQPVFPVVQDHEYLGACTIRGLMTAPPDTHCGALLDPHVPAIDAEAPLEGAVATLMHDRAETAVVVSDGVVLGLFRLEDVARMLETPASTGSSAPGLRALVDGADIGQTSQPRKDN